MNNFIYVITLPLLVRAGFKLLFVLKTLYRYLGGAPKDNELSPDRTIVIIAKVYREKRTIGSLVRYLAQLTSRYEGVSAIVVGTARERNSDEINETLLAATQHVEKQTDKITILEAPGTSEKPAWQLNFAAGTISSDSTRTWLLFMDVDTRFSVEGFEELLHHVNRGVPIIQQSALFLSNYQDLDFFQKGHALLQSRWSISHEMLRIQLNYLCRWVLAHVVGHGLCIELATLSKHGGFPTETFAEDIHLGYNLCVRGERIQACVNFDSSDCPPTLIEGLKQEYSWSFGPMSYPIFLRSLRKKVSGIEVLRAWLLATQGVVLYCNWLVVTWVLLLLAFLSFQGEEIATLFLVVYMAEHVLCMMLFALMGQLKISQIPEGLLALPIALLRHSLPANVAGIRRLVGITHKRHKAPH